MSLARKADASSWGENKPPKVSHNQPSKQSLSKRSSHTYPPGKWVRADSVKVRGEYHPKNIAQERRNKRNHCPVIRIAVTNSRPKHQKHAKQNTKNEPQPNSLLCNGMHCNAGFVFPEWFFGWYRVRRLFGASLPTQRMLG